jgi:hypothetical protein
LQHAKEQINYRFPTFLRRDTVSVNVLTSRSVIVGVSLLATWIVAEALFFFLQEFSHPLKLGDRKSMSWASSGYGTFDDAALALEKIAAGSGLRRSTGTTLNPCNES